MSGKVSIYDIARHVKVSPASVSYVINGVDKVGAETKQKILKAIKELGYVPNFTARALSTGKSHLIGILLPLMDASIAFLQNPFYVEFIGGFEKGIFGSDYDIVIGIQSDDLDLSKWTRRNIDALVLIGSHKAKTYEIIKNNKMPVVLIDDDSMYAEEFHNVKSDDEEGMYLATKYLLSMNHQKIGFVGNHKAYLVDKKRYDGFMKAMMEANLAVNDDQIYLADATMNDGLVIAEEIRRRGNVSAVVCSGDILGMAIIKKYKSMGLDVPKDLSVVGFDDIQTSNLITPGLTTIHQDIGKKGEVAAQIIIDYLENKTNEIQNICLKPYLVTRESVAKHHLL